jgi:hypothetical protein
MQDDYTAAGQEDKYRRQEEIFGPQQPLDKMTMIPQIKFK